jgi:Flp pilus assembly protein TadG
MMNCFMKIARDESGQSIAELGLMVTMFSLLLVGAIDFGCFVYSEISVANAARAGVQYASLTITTASNVGSSATNIAIADGNLTSSTAPTFAPGCTDGLTYPPVTVPTTGCASGQHELVFAEVTANKTFTPFTLYMSPKTITTSAVMSISP